MQTRRDADPAVADMTGSGALPRRSGELVFHEPWERRAFAMAVSLSRDGRFEWKKFRQNLISAIDSDRARATASKRPPGGYYERWLIALEQTLLDSGIISRIE